MRIHDLFRKARNAFGLTEKLFKLSALHRDHHFRLSFAPLEDRVTPTGAPASAQGSMAGQLPEVRLFDSQGALIRSFLAFEATMTAGVQVALADTSGDGVPDAVVTATSLAGPKLRVFDGVTGAMLKDVGSNGSSVLDPISDDGSIGLVDSPEYAVGSNANLSPKVHVFGVSGREIHNFLAYDSNYAGGVSASVADMNADGVGDVVVTPTVSSGLKGRVFSGANWQLLSEFTPTDYFKPAELPFVPEVFPGRIASYAVGAGSGVAPIVKVLDADGLLVRSFLAFEPQFKGGVRVALADLNLDGVTDVVAAPGPGGGPRIRAFDGNSGAVIADFYAYASSFNGGVNIAAGPIGNGQVGIATGADAGGGPHVRVFDVTGKIVRDFFAYETNFTGGVRVALGGSSTGSPLLFTSPGKGGGPRIRSFEVSTGSVRLDEMVYDASFRGGVNVAAADLNNDGTAELVASPSAGGGPHVRAIDGVTGDDVESFFTSDPTDLSGTVTRVVNLPSGGQALASVVDRAGNSWVRVLANSSNQSTLSEVSSIGPFPGLGKGISFAATTDLGALNILADEGEEPDLPVISIQAYDPSAIEILKSGEDEYSTTGLFRLVRKGDVTDELTIRGVLSGTATFKYYDDESVNPDGDYTSSALFDSLLETGHIDDVSITFEAGSPVAWIRIEAIDDETPEFTETVVITLSPSDAVEPEYKLNAAFISASIDVHDNDHMPLWGSSELPNVWFDPSEINAATESTPRSGSAHVTVKRSDTAGPLDIGYSFGGTAVRWLSGKAKGHDYHMIASDETGGGQGTIHFEDGSDTASVAWVRMLSPELMVDLTGMEDWEGFTDHEEIETVTFTLQPGAYSLIGSSDKTVYLYDNDWVGPVPGKYYSHLHFDGNGAKLVTSLYVDDAKLDYNNPADVAYIYLRHEISYEGDGKDPIVYPPEAFPVELNYYGDAVAGVDYSVSGPEYLGQYISFEVGNPIGQQTLNRFYRLTFHSASVPQPNRPANMYVSVFANSTEWTTIGRHDHSVVSSATSASISINNPSTEIVLPVISVIAPDPVSAEQLVSRGSFTIVSEYPAGAPNALPSYTFEGSASVGDYQAVVASSSFYQNKRYDEIVIIPIDDELEEGTETVTLKLAPSTAYRIEEGAEYATVIILDNDPDGLQKATDFEFGPMYAPTYVNLADSTQPEFQASVSGRLDATERYGLIAESATRAANNKSENGIRYADGAIALTVNDLVSVTQGELFGVSRTYSNVIAYSKNTIFGDGWSDPNRPFLERNEDETTVAVMSNGLTPRYFDKDPETGEFTGQYFIRETLARLNDTYVMTTATGSVISFYDFNGYVPEKQRGQVKQMTDEAGNQVSFQYDAAGYLEYMTRSGTGAVMERIRYAYVNITPDDKRVARAYLERANGSAWQIVRYTEYQYYQKGSAYGKISDLKYAILRTESGQELEREYYRYRVVKKDPSLLTTVVGHDAYRRITATVGSPESLPDASLDQYADYTYKYGSSRRVSEQTVAGAGSSQQGGRGKYTYSYGGSANDPDDGMNVWIVRTAETLPDGTVQDVYTNKLGEVMLKIIRVEAGEETQEWLTYHAYDKDGRRILTANPSAVNGFQESLPDLVGLDDGDYGFIRDDQGLIQTIDWYDETSATTSSAGGATGYYQGSRLRQGDLGSPILQDQVQYFLHSGSSVNRFDPAMNTRYRSEDASGEVMTQFAYTYSGLSITSMSVTSSMTNERDPVLLPSKQPTTKTTYDSFSRPSTFTDEIGNASSTQYDDKSGGVKETIVDSAGLALKTTRELDILGRPTKVTVGGTGEERNDYFFYDDIRRETRQYQGWVVAIEPTESKATGLTLITRNDPSGYYSETLSMAATPALTKAGLPTGKETIGTIQSMTRTIVSKAGQVTFTDAYSKLGASDYSTGTRRIVSADAASLRTAYAYDDRGRMYATRSPDRVVSMTLYDALGRAETVWTGSTTIAPEGWALTGATGLTQISESKYDNGHAGDGNLTQLTVFPGDGAASRITSTVYDWRNRPVFLKDGDETTEATELNRPVTYQIFDNLNQLIESSVYDGDGLEPVDLDEDGVPDNPAESDVVPYTVSSMMYDDRGQVYHSELLKYSQTGVFAGAPVAGLPAVTETWYDLRGLPIAVTLPTGRTEKTEYDGARRVTRVSQAISVDRLAFHVLYGDGDGNGLVDANDMNMFLVSLGTSSSSSSFNPAFDYNNDGTISYDDFGYFGNAFGKSLTTSLEHPSLTIESEAAQRSRINDLTIELPGILTQSGEVILRRYDATTKDLNGEIKAKYTETTVSGGTLLTVDIGSGTATFKNELLYGHLTDGDWTIDLPGFEVDSVPVVFSDIATTTYDKVLSETESIYDTRGNVIEVISRERFDNTTGVGPLGTSSSGVHARVTIADQYYDRADRLTHSVSVGRNDSWTRSETPPSLTEAQKDHTPLTQYQYTYEVDGMHLTVIDPYDASTITITDLLGRTTQTSVGNSTIGILNTVQTFDAVTGQLSQVTAPGGVVTKYWYDSQGHLAESIERYGSKNDQSSQKVTYNAIGEVISTTDPYELVTKTYRDLLGRVSKIVDMEGDAKLERKVTNTFMPTGDLLSQTDARDHTLNYVYTESAGTLVEAIDEEDVISFQRFDQGRRVVLEGTGAQTVQTSYDILDRVTSTRDALGYMTRQRYLVDGNEQQSINPLFQVTRETIDDQGRPYQFIDALKVTQEKTVYGDSDRSVTVYDEFGTSTVTMYDALNRPSTITEGATSSYARTTAYQYSPTFGTMIQVTDPRTNNTKYIPDDFGRTITIEYANGETIGYEYDLLDRVNKVTQNGIVTVTSFTKYGMIESVLDTGKDNYGYPATRVTNYSYDKNDNLEFLTDAEGRRTTYLYDAANRKVSETKTSIVTKTGSEEVTTTYQYDSRNFLTKILEPGNTPTTQAITTYTYDNAGRKTSSKNAINKTTNYYYDAAGLLRQVRNPLLQSQFTEYDATGRITSTSDSMGHTTTTQYLDTFTDMTSDLVIHGRVVVTDPRTNTTISDMDQYGRVVRVYNAKSEETRYTYDDNDNLVTTFNVETDSVQKTDYDKLNHVKIVYPPYAYDDGDGEPGKYYQEYFYDSYGRLDQVTDEKGATTKYGYDAFNRQSTVSYPDAGIWTTVYDNIDRIAQTADPNSRVTTFNYERYDLNQPTSVVSPLTEDETGLVTFTVNYTYDNRGNKTHLIDANKNDTVYAYDLHNRLITETDPNAKVTTYGYDNADRLTSITDRMGQKRQYVYDSAGRKTDEKWYAKSATTPFQTQIYDYDEANNLVSVEGPDVSYSLVYDALNRASTVTQIQGMANVTQTFSYDGAGNRKTSYIENSVDSMFTQVHSTYDLANRLKTQTMSNTLASVGMAYDYNDRGELTDVDRKLGTATVGWSVLQYDPAGRASATTHSSIQNGSTDLLSYGFVFDVANRVKTLGDAINSYEYDYNYNNELTSLKVNTVSVFDQTYDSAGNRTGSKLTTPPPGMEAATVTTGNRVTDAKLGWTYEYNDNGEMSSKYNVAGDVWSYAYDPRGQMTDASLANPLSSDTTSVHYTYDGFGNRVGRTEWQNGTVVRDQIFIMDGWDPAKAGAVGSENFDTVMDLNADGFTTDQRLFARGFDRPVIHLDDAGDATWYLTDHQGSIRGLMAEDGSLAATRDYGAFGEAISPGSWPDRYGYTGRELDETLGLQYGRARMLDLATGRWQSEDPKGQAAGDVNLYRYVSNGPTNRNDPSGMEEKGFFGRAWSSVVDSVDSAATSVQYSIVTKLQMDAMLMDVAAAKVKTVEQQVFNHPLVIANAKPWERMLIPVASELIQGGMSTQAAANDVMATGIGGDAKEAARKAAAYTGGVIGNSSPLNFVAFLERTTADVALPAGYDRSLLYSMPEGPFKYSMMRDKIRFQAKEWNALNADRGDVSAPFVETAFTLPLSPELLGIKNGASISARATTWSMRSERSLILLDDAISSAPKNIVGKSELGNALSDLGTNPLGRNLNRLEEFGNGAGFSGVLDLESGKFLSYASGETKLANGATPLNLVEQYGGHRRVNSALSGVLGNSSANRLGFSMVLDAEGNFAVKYNSAINSANPNVLGRTVPESMRQQILDAISKSTGRKAYSAP